MEMAIMDLMSFNNTSKATVSFLFIIIIGLFSPTATAQEDVVNNENVVQRLDEVTIDRGSISQLEGFEAKTFPKNPFSVGFGSDYSDDIEANYEITNNLPFNLKIYTRSPDWRDFNTGDSLRSSVAIAIFQF